MNAPLVHVRELAAWGFDDYEYRPSLAQPSLGDVLQERASYQPATAVASAEWDWLRARLHSQAERTDLLEEVAGLDWRTDVIDLRLLLSFQRRLAFDPRVEKPPPIPHQAEAEELIACAFGLRQTPSYEIERSDAHTLLLRSPNPNLQISFSERQPLLAVSCGSPFLEVAEFRNRWFLRDGYHRAYNLLRGDVPVVPALVVKATTIDELGATRPRFFDEAVLFSDFPPKVVDFLDDRLNITYARPFLTKTLRFKLEESFTPETG